MPSLFEQDIGNLKGVGSKRRAFFEKLGVTNIGSLLYFFPKGYEDWSVQTSISEAKATDIVCIKGRISSTMCEHKISYKSSVYKFTVSDGTGIMQITFFNNRYVLGKFKVNDEFLFYGKIKSSYKCKEMISPAYSPVTAPPNIRPIYHQTEGLTTRQIEVAQKNALKLLPDKVRDPIPETVRNKYSLCELKYAIENIHFPKDKSVLAESTKRLAFEEFLVLQLGLHRIKKESVSKNDFILDEDFSNEFWGFLPFSPTSAQLRVLLECTKDMSSGFTMRRLIQGDVGSGKTAVAAGICYNIIKSGAQAAIMVPTEILAKQHYDSLRKIFKNTNIKIELLTGSTKKAHKRLIKDCLESGVTDLVVGTHALISDDVCFKNLGVVITDEQHRFGVSQRTKLAAKGRNPHIVVMSATPIPRTLALILYGDMDVSILDEMPPGRKHIDTFYIEESKRERAFDFIKKLIDEGHQAYIVCPLVDESESNLISATEYAERIKKEQFCNYRVGLLHGKMNTFDKNSVMDDFSSGKIDILVSTTVIEVGVDVKNAVIMLIENAERFGLSQLHQLRGRVGRGNFKSYCILVSSNKNDETVKRLKIIENLSDGIKIADEDLKIRGPGDFFGTKQHGLPILKNASLLNDINILSNSKKAAEEILVLDCSLSLDEHRYLKAEVRRLFNKTEYGFSF